ncbi:hypothetical protein [Rhizorhabdus phycosphaerae]|uniref:hypothetical protein n=1 Tax=Rhizorhabdus phycosphaerae TaxID=2711156 RepID=UPI0013EA4A4C|nr:hypothetical protein [Rhizorhabdus phycosphaerae]
MEHGVAEKWLKQRAPGFSQLPPADRRAISDFALLWSLFESRIMGGFARADHIRARVDQWSTQESLEAERYDAELAYFRARYFANGALTYRFDRLELRANDHPDLLAAVLSGADDDPRNRMLVLLMIIWRLRNNLFHGAKWQYQLAEQHGNFTHANAVLMRLLDRHGQLG